MISKEQFEILKKGIVSNQVISINYALNNVPIFKNKIKTLKTILYDSKIEQSVINRLIGIVGDLSSSFLSGNYNLYVSICNLESFIYYSTQTQIDSLQLKDFASQLELMNRSSREELRKIYINNLKAIKISDGRVSQLPLVFRKAVKPVFYKLNCSEEDTIRVELIVKVLLE